LVASTYIITIIPKFLETPMTSSTSSSQRPLLPSSGRELLLDLKRSVLSGTNGGGGGGSNAIPILPTYNSKLVQECFQDLFHSVKELELAIASLDRSNYDDQNDNDHDDNNAPNKDNTTNNQTKKGTSNFSMSSRPVILLHSESIERCKRCLLAYHYQRMEIMKQIQRLIHNPSSSSSSSSTTDDDDVVVVTNKNISANKHEVNFVRTYTQLRQSYSSKVFELDMPPPTSHMVQIRVVQDIGPVVLPQTGRSVNMIKGACMYLERVDVQDFLQEGMVQLYDGEEMDF
jgi:hypothetical protein